MSDDGLDGHLWKTFDMICPDYEWDSLHKCCTCNTRRFCREQALTWHLIWHSNPVVAKAPNDDDKVHFEATHKWLYQFKAKYLWPDNLYTNLIEGMPSSGDSSDSS